MKNFDLKNTGILLAIMLVAGAVLVGPVSAYSENTESSAAGYFWVSAVGDYEPNLCTQYSGYSWTKSGNDAGRLCVKVEFFDGYGNLLIPYNRYTLYNVQDLEVSGTLYHPNKTYYDPYIKTTMNSDNPDDIGFVYAYLI